MLLVVDVGVLGGHEKRCGCSYVKRKWSAVPIAKIGMNSSHQHIETKNYKNKEFTLSLKGKVIRFTVS